MKEGSEAPYNIPHCCKNLAPGQSAPNNNSKSSPCFLQKENMTPARITKESLFFLIRVCNCETREVDLLSARAS